MQAYAIRTSMKLVSVADVSASTRNSSDDALDLERARVNGLRR